MNITLVSLNSKYIHSSLAPWCIKAGVSCFCHDKHNISVKECTVNDSLQNIYSKITEDNCDLIAFCCYIWNIEKVLELSELLKSNLGLTIALGGPEVQYRAKDILTEFSFIDYVISGEGEWAFSSFIECLSERKSFSDSEGLTYRSAQGILSIPEKYHNETPPSPYSSEYLSKVDSRIAYIEASRGCPFSCAYCLSGRLGKLRYFDFDYITENIILLSNSGAKTIKFVDRTFNSDKYKAKAILEFILKNYKTRIKEDLCFHFEIAADILDSELLSVFRQMPVGLIQLEIGIQSFNNATLESINRKSDTTKLKEVIAELISMDNMHIHIDLIAGLPYEDYNSFRYSFNEAYKLKAHMLQAGFLKILSGSPMENIAGNYGYVFNPKPPYEIIRNDFLSEKDILRLKACESALDKLYNSGRFLFTLRYLFEMLNLNPFDTFVDIGLNCLTYKMSLSELAESLYKYFSDKCDKNILRDAILCDIASLNVKIKIPDCLETYDPLYKQLKKKYTELFHKNVRLVILKSQNKVFVCQCDSADILSKRYKGNIYDL